MNCSRVSTWSSADQADAARKRNGLKLYRSLPNSSVSFEPLQSYLRFKMKVVGESIHPYQGMRVVRHISSEESAIPYQHGFVE